MTKERESASDAGKAVPIRHIIPEDLPTVAGNTMVVQHTEHEFVLMFFDVIAPILVGDEEQRREYVERLTHVEARCVARVVVSAERLPSVIQALRDNYEKWERDRASQSEEDDAS